MGWICNADGWDNKCIQNSGRNNSHKALHFYYQEADNINTCTKSIIHFAKNCNTGIKMKISMCEGMCWAFSGCDACNSICSWTEYHGASNCHRNLQNPTVFTEFVMVKHSSKDLRECSYKELAIKCRSWWQFFHVCTTIQHFKFLKGTKFKSKCGAIRAYLMLVYTLLRIKFSTFCNNSLFMQGNSENYMPRCFQVLLINSKF